MYIPSANRVDDPERIAEFIANHGFATVVTSVDGVPFASHLPVQFDPANRQIWGHMARANEHWRYFGGTTESLCIFHGPHAYISPSWYASSVAVPTWNYAAAHVYGTTEVVEDEAVVRRIVDDLTRQYEAGRETPWELSRVASLLPGLLKAVVGFRIHVTRIECKFKLGQNRSAEDQARMRAAVRTEPGADARALAEFMDAEHARRTPQPPG